MSKASEVIAIIKPGVQETQETCKILACVSAAQIILESGWLKHCPGNNPCGIKAGIAWKGKTVLVTTKEFIKGKYVTIKARFRAYPTIADGILDHGKFLAQNKRYKNIIGVTDYKTVCQNLQRDGYATCPTYGDKLIKLIEQYNLQRLNLAVVKSVVSEYTVKKGDTLSSIAAAHHTTYTKLAAANGIHAPYVIHVGDKIKIAA